MTARRAARAGIAVVAIASLALLSACDDDSSGGAGPEDFNQSFKRGKNESSVQVGDAEIPADFPSSAVPLPGDGSLQAVVTGKVPPNRYYTLTYGLGGRNGVAAGADYRRRLERAGFEIRNYLAERSTDTNTGFASFDALSDQWDVFVVSGRGSRRERPALSIQVSTHGTLSGLGEQSILGPEESTTTSSTSPDDVP
jgi:hypothetical protein